MTYEEEEQKDIEIDQVCQILEKMELKTILQAKRFTEMLRAMEKKHIDTDKIMFLLPDSCRQ